MDRTSFGKDKRSPSELKTGGETSRRHNDLFNESISKDSILRDLRHNRHASHSEDIPSQETLDGAKLHRFGNRSNDTYKVIIDNGESEAKAYFVKKYYDIRHDPNNIRYYHNEVVAYQVGIAMGVKDHLISVKLMNYQGDPALVSPWSQSHPLIELSNQQILDIMDKLSDAQFTRLSAYEYVMSDRDRHMGNYMLDNGVLKIIDMGLAGNDTTVQFLYSRNISWEIEKPLIFFRAQARGMEEEHISLDKGTIMRDTVFQRDLILTAVRVGGMTNEQIQGVAKRIDVLERFTSSAAAYTVGDLVNLSKA